METSLEAFNGALEASREECMEASVEPSMPGSTFFWQVFPESSVREIRKTIAEASGEAVEVQSNGQSSHE